LQFTDARLILEHLFMNKPWEIDGSSVLVFSDVHQDLQWVKDVLKAEDGNYDQILFNGDIIHGKRNDRVLSGTRETAIFYKWLLDNYPVNIGNHELPIYESWERNSKFQTHKEPYYRMGGWTKSSTLHFNREMTRQDWEKPKLFRVVHGFLVSHAGFHPIFWNFNKTIDENLQFLWDSSILALSTIPKRHEASAFFEAGPARYYDPSHARVKVGGPVWLDWNDEFLDGLPLPQLVGHTPKEMTVRRIGNSYNIDGKQTTYAIIKEHGISFHALQDGKKVPPLFEVSR